MVHGRYPIALPVVGPPQGTGLLSESEKESCKDTGKTIPNGEPESPLGGESERGDRHAAKVSHSSAFGSLDGTGAGLSKNKSSTVFLDV